MRPSISASGRSIRSSFFFEVSVGAGKFCEIFEELAHGFARGNAAFKRVFRAARIVQIDEVFGVGRDFQKFARQCLRAEAFGLSGKFGYVGRNVHFVGNRAKPRLQEAASPRYNYVFTPRYNIGKSGFRQLHIAGYVEPFADVGNVYEVVADCRKFGGVGLSRTYVHSAV